MKVLITGAYGFVGTNLCKYLTERGHECDALDVPSAKRDDVPYVHFHTWDEVVNRQRNEAEAENGNSLPDSSASISSSACASASSLRLSSYDAVVHLAGKAHDLKKVASEQSYFDVNVGLTEKIFAAAQGKVQCFVYFSSSKAAADGNAYGRSKFAAEQYLLSASSSSASACPSASALRTQTIILRPAMIHGPGNKGNLNLLWGIARRGLPWPLAAFENKRSFTSIGNVCAAVEALIVSRQRNEAESGRQRNEAEAEKGKSLPDPSACASTAVRIYSIADDEMISTNRLIELIAEACGRKAKLWRLPKRLMTLAAKVGDVCRLPLNSERLGKLTEDSFVDNAALKKALGWAKMPIAAEDGMRLTLASFKQK